MSLLSVIEECAERTEMTPEQNQLARIEHKLDRILARLQPKGKLMATFDELLAKVTRNTSLIESAKTAFAGLRQLLADKANALPSLSDADKAVLDGIVQRLGNDDDTLAAAMVTNTSAALTATTAAPVATAATATAATAATAAPDATTAAPAAPDATTAAPVGTTPSPAQAPAQS